MIQSVTPFETAITPLCTRIKQILSALPLSTQQTVNEIRLRVGRPVTLHMATQTRLLRECGEPVIAQKNDIEESYRRICDFSVYSHQEEIRQGYITVCGGHRVGICGTAVLQQGQITTIREISSLNIRIARQIYGSADQLLRRLGQGIAKGLLIAGPPACGKTTLLRDLVRQLATGTGSAPKKVAVIDERGELAATYCGVWQNDLGLCCDVLDHYPKGAGILQAIRSLSPEVIVCDELGGQEDVEAIRQGLYAGVAVIATVHAGSEAELLCKKQGRALLKTGAFGAVAVMSGVVPGEIAEIYKARDLLGEIGGKRGADKHNDAAGLSGVV